MAKQRLGKGLGALIPAAAAEAIGASGPAAMPTVPIDLIDPNPFQPRSGFGEEEMASLVASIKAKGIIQPLTVREGKDGRYDLIAGERRMRASKEAGLDEVPVYIVSVDTDVEMMEFALIENIQREDLNPIDEAEAYALLISKYDMKQEQIADQVGKSRPAVANYLRLLRLPSEIKDSVKVNEITVGHARALLGLPQPALMQKLWKKIVAEGLNVRQTESEVQAITNPDQSAETLKKSGPAKSKAAPDSTFLNHVEVELLGKLSTKVRVKDKGQGNGVIEISYYSSDDLERILDIILKDEGE